MPRKPRDGIGSGCSSGFEHRDKAAGRIKADRRALLEFWGKIMERELLYYPVALSKLNVRRAALMKEIEK